MAWSYQSLPELPDDQFLRWQALLEQRTGINFAQHKSILQAGLNRRMREINCDDYSLYYARVVEPKKGPIEWTALLNSLTVGETSFFRQPEAFEFLKSYISQRQLECQNEDRPLELWSVGCSSGEEAYSLAMLTHECLDEHAFDQYFGVIGSDISLAALSQARQGIYRNRKLQFVDSTLQQRYFQMYDANQSQIHDWLRRKVCFVQANMIDLGSVPIDNMDIIFCQNVLVYFRRDCQRAVLDELVSRLRTGGVLVAGLGETVGWQNPAVKRVADERIQAYIKQ
jgi:chemotaxis methyl-accepting protein methylase